MRLNWFLPALPAQRRGPVRRVLGWLGPSWSASPARRVVQTISLVAFLWLFFCVAWPYTARPARTWPGWVPEDVDAATGRVCLVTEQAGAHAPAGGAIVYAADTSGAAPQPLAAFRVSEVQEKKLVLDPIESLPADRLDLLSTSFGPWSLSEKPPGSWPSHYADDLQAKELLPAELFLAIDPLVSISTALAARAWVWSLAAAGAVLVACLLIPRGFCGYVCPLGTLIDLFDWAVSKRVPWFRAGRAGWWRHLRHYLLASVLAASLGGVLLAGFVSAIPVVTRGLAFILSPLQLGMTRGWHQVPPLGAGQVFSIVLFCFVFAFGLLGPRFWCKYVCPSGAVFSIANLLRITERKLARGCIKCGKCREVCPFGAIEEDYTTRAGECAFCQTCGGVCPAGAIQFSPRWESAPGIGATAPEARTGEKGTVPFSSNENRDSPLNENRDSPLNENWDSPLTHSRRRFLTITTGVAAGAVGGGAAALAVTRQATANDRPVVRPPGSVPEAEFLQLCIRCGECYQACPNSVLQPLGFEQGWAGLWTPRIVADWSGCEPSCSNCGQVCPTGAIRALRLDEKRTTAIGLAVVDRQTCLPYAGVQECQFCVDECRLAGYDAIEFVRVGTMADEFGNPLADTGLLAPVVVADRCVGCGLCQTRCRTMNVKTRGLLAESAIRVEAG